MLTHLKLDNFKIWRSTGPMRLAPLTLLLGTNSSGKSSLIQSLLLIRQTVKGDDPNLDLNLGNPDANDSVTLGQFKDLLCRHGVASPSNPDNQVGIEFRWAEDGAAADSVLFSARYRKGESGSAELEYLRLGKDGEGFMVERRKPGIYRLWLGNESKSEGQSADYRPHKSFAFSAEAIAELGEHGEAIKDVGPALLDELSKIIYLGPVRRLAQRHYFLAGRKPVQIGDDGDQAAEALIAGCIAVQRSSARKGPNASALALVQQTIRWLKAMELADDLAVRTLRTPARHELLVSYEGESSNLKDVGVGVSQVLPVIVAALLAEPGHIVIVEEPESHLHPLAQSELANLFAEVSRERGVQFIVETHSEHLFRRMQTLMARSEVSADECAMYFIEREGKQAKVKELDVDELGRIRNWPPLFFGDALGETREQTELAIKRAKEMRAQDGKVPG